MAVHGFRRTIRGQSHLQNANEHVFEYDFVAARRCLDGIATIGKAANIRHDLLCAGTSCYHHSYEYNPNNRPPVHTLSLIFFLRAQIEDQERAVWTA